MAKRLEDLPIYQYAVMFCDATNAILLRRGRRRNRKLWNQIAEANDSILSNMKEGFEQSSDDAFANMVNYAKGSCAEVVSRTFQAHRRRYVTAEEYAERHDMGEQLQRMMGGFINYLRRSGFKDRGAYRSTHPDGTPPKAPTQAPAPRPPADPASEGRPSNRDEPPPVA
jgi:four helix bundle protein